MKINQMQEGSVTIISVEGSLDALTAPQLTRHVTAQLETGKFNLVVDLAQLDYTSSAGLRVLLNTVKEARSHGGDLRLAATQPNVHKVFEMSGFLNIMKFFPDTASAVASF